MRNKLLVFFFSWFFGAGQMYLGYMKRGVTLMSLFMGTIFLSAATIPHFAFILPIIYAYAFFDTFNIARYTPEERAQNPDSFLLNIDKLFAFINLDKIYNKRHKWIGWGVIAFGVAMMFNNFIEPILWQFYYAYNFEWLARLINNVPSFVISALLLVLGTHILKSQIKPSENEDIVTFTKGEK